jgi:hypothetical protein
MLVAGDEDMFDRGTKALPGRMTIVESYTLVVLKYKEFRVQNLYQMIMDSR